MRKTSPKIISISDLIQWESKNELTLSPKYQRNSVWNEKAKSYLLDTIVRGLPIPPIFLRQTIDVGTKRTFRELIDGQQRVRAIIDFVNNKFPIHRNHNSVYGGKYYDDLDDDIKENILQYELTSEVISEDDDTVIYDMFARLNSNNIVLNKQEIRNARYTGDFKVIVYKLAKQYRDFFIKHRFVSDKDCSRMKDAEIVNSMLILILEGIIEETPTKVDNVYKEYDECPEDKLKDIECKLSFIMNDIFCIIYEDYNDLETKILNKNYFYTLFCFVYHQVYGIKDFECERIEQFSKNEIEKNLYLFEKKLSVFLRKLETNEKYIIDDSDSITRLEFIQYHSRRTTNKKERTERIKMITRFMVSPNV